MPKKTEQSALTPLHEQAKQYRVELSKVAFVALPLDCGSMHDAWEWYQMLGNFFKENGIQHGSVEIQISGYDTSLEGVAVTASVDKTDAELQNEINELKNRRVAQVTFGRKIAKENAKKRKEYELKEYERLKKKFEGSK